MIIAIIILSIILIGAGLGCYILFKKLKNVVQIFEQQQELINEYDEDNKTLKTHLVEVLTKIELVYRHIQIIDSRGTFENDDEVGQIYKDISNSVHELKNYINGFSVMNEVNDKATSQQEEYLNNISVLRRKAGKKKTDKNK